MVASRCAASVQELVASEARIVTVIGSPGIGKSALVAAVDADVRVDLSEVDDEAGLVRAVAGALNVTDDVSIGIATRLSELGDGVVALDGCDRVLEPLRRLHNGWLTSHDATLLITSPNPARCCRRARRRAVRTR